MGSYSLFCMRIENNMQKTTHMVTIMFEITSQCCANWNVIRVSSPMTGRQTGSVHGLCTDCSVCVLIKHDFGM